MAATRESLMRFSLERDLKISNMRKNLFETLFFKWREDNEWGIGFLFLFYFFISKKFGDQNLHVIDEKWIQIYNG